MNLEQSKNPLYQRIYSIVPQIPLGSIASYGQVAQAAGLFRGARIVGWALGHLSPEQTAIPWQRVVNQKGRVSIINPHVTAQQQADLLEQEGNILNYKDGLLEIQYPNWHTFDKRNEPSK